VESHPEFLRQGNAIQSYQLIGLCVVRVIRLFQGFRNSVSLSSMMYGLYLVRDLRQDHLATSHSELIPRMWISYFQNDPADSNPLVAKVFTNPFCLFVTTTQLRIWVQAGRTINPDSIPFKGKRFFFSSKASRLALKLTTHYSLVCVNAWNCTSIPPYDFTGMVFN